MPGEGTVLDRDAGQGMEPLRGGSTSRLLHSFLRKRPRTPAAALRAVWIVFAAGGAVCAGHAAWGVFQTWSGTPSCSWPLRVRGPASAERNGLVRCYLRALAEHDTSGLLAIADNHQAVRITSASLGHSADARTGPATATFTSTPDSTYFLMTITYADGAREATSIQNMIAWGGPAVWRMNIGTQVKSGW
jgi:hypothetical protein